MTRERRAAFPVSGSSIGSVPTGALFIGTQQACCAETGEWSALNEAKALYPDNVSDWFITRRPALLKDLSQPTIISPQFTRCCPRIS